MAQKSLLLRLKHTLLLSALASFALPTVAATLTVTSTSDVLGSESACTLRGAVAAVNGAADANGCVAAGTYGDNDTIVFADALAALTVQFASEIQISRALTIQGPAAAENDATKRVTLAGGGVESNFRLLNVTGEAALNVRDLNFTNGVLSLPFQAGGAILGNNSTIAAMRCTFSRNQSTYQGGAISANTVMVSASTFDSNSAVQQQGETFAAANTFSVEASPISGGAISANRLMVGASTFSGNFAGAGGAVWAGTADISASTFSGNVAMSLGGAIIVQGMLKARHLTLVDNFAPNGAAVYLNGVSGDAVADIANSLIVGNNSNLHCAGASEIPFAGGYNLGWRVGESTPFNDVSCGAANAIDASTTLRDQIVAATLADNGGMTFTLALPANSPAIGQADKTGSSEIFDIALSSWVDATLDQRGLLRKAASAGRDLGAVEGVAMPVNPGNPPDADGHTHVDVITNEQGLQTIVGFFVPLRSELGRPGAVFIFVLLPDNSIWLLDSSGHWHRFTDCRMMPAVFTGNLQALSDIPIFPTPVDLSLYAGSELYIGYGFGGYMQPSGAACNSMIAGKNWVKVYTSS